jgi:hypothetical protein
VQEAVHIPHLAEFNQRRWEKIRTQATLTAQTCSADTFPVFYMYISLFVYYLTAYLFNPSTYITYLTTVKISSIYRVLKKSYRFYGSVVLTEIIKKDQINVSPDISVCLDIDNVRVIAASDALCGFHARQGNFSTLRLTKVRTLKNSRFHSSLLTSTAKFYPSSKSNTNIALILEDICVRIHVD